MEDLKERPLLMLYVRGSNPEPSLEKLLFLSDVMKLPGDDKCTFDLGNTRGLRLGKRNKKSTLMLVVCGQSHQTRTCVLFVCFWCIVYRK